MIPDGYVAHGWHRFNSGMSGLWYGSAVHLAPAENVYSIRGGTDERVYGSLCGRERRGRGSYADSPSQVLAELVRGERTLCKNCLKKANA